MAENKLYYGDNLDILYRYVADESVDLIYLDPPFKSSQDYNVIFAEQNGTRSAAQVKAFEDTWMWDDVASRSYQEVVEYGGRVSEAMQAFRKFLGTNDMLAYLSMMAPRLAQLRRVLKPTGSVYLHCDPTASHYLKILMDSVFGPTSFCNEIIWHYRKWPTGKRVFQRNHDVILFYARSGDRRRVFNQLFMERTPSTLRRFGKARIVSGRDSEGRRVPSRTEDEESEGVRQDDVWEIGRVPPIRQLFPTQKPEPLLERVILASSREGDLVLDPFCGCGTTIVVAQRLNRRWVGIDITHLAISLIRHRLAGTDAAYGVVGEPVSVADAEALARQDPYQFQYWALGLVHARPVEQKKGSDRGIDGRLYFHDDKSGKTKQIVFSVKSGRVAVSDVRDLRGVVERESAEIGVLITLEEPTRPMRREAASGGFYDSPWGTRHPRLQILTIHGLLAGEQLDSPRSRGNVTFKKAPRAKPSNQVHEGGAAYGQTGLNVAESLNAQFETTDE
jgi:DNA modification methylase